MFIYLYLVICENKAISKFDSNPHIQRYAYFGNGCTDALRKVALFTESDMTSIGQIYISTIHIKSPKLDSDKSLI